jgi:hypothetical protein
MGAALTFDEAVAILAASGIVADDQGFKMLDLVHAAECRGWRVTTEHTATAHRRRRWRVALSCSLPPRGYLVGAQGYGTTEEEALVIALASMIRWMEPRGV